MGLLSRASILDNTAIIPGLAFSDFINKHSVKLCALLEKNNNNYIVANSIGFDGKSILSATSTVDFWEGICPESYKLYSFSETENTKLLQLFSFDLKDSISELSVYKTSASKIFLISGTPSYYMTEDLEKINDSVHKNNYLSLNPLIKDNSVVLLLNIDCTNAVRNYFNAEVSDNSINYDSFTKAINNELYNRFACKYNITDTTVQKEPLVFKTVFITNKTYSIELIKHHIILNLKEVLDNHSQFIEIKLEGTADSCNQVESFLQAE